MLVPKSTPAAPTRTTTTVSDTAAATTSALRIRTLWPTRPFRCALSPRWSGRHRAKDQAARYRLMTWPLNFVSRDEFWETPFPRCWRGILGPAAANRGAESGRGSAVLISARPHAAHGSARCFFITGGRQPRHFDGRRAAGPAGSARFVPLAGLDRTLDPGGSRGQRGRPGGSKRRLGLGRDPAPRHRAC